jgi:hypothetical protein
VTTVTRDRGAADALGLVLIAPAVVGLAMLVVALGRGVDARARSQSAAESAAQAAALERDAAGAVAAAHRVAESMLLADDSCRRPEVVVDTSGFRPGGEVRVTIECQSSSRAVESVQATDRPQRATAVARVDWFRASETST